MLTQQEMLVIAEKYTSFMSNDEVEIIVINQLTMKKTYGNIFYPENKKYFETGDFKYHVIIGPFLVEKETGRVVNFGTAHDLDFYLNAYEKEELELSLGRYWYPDSQKYDFK